MTHVNPLTLPPASSGQVLISDGSGSIKYKDLIPSFEEGAEWTPRYVILKDKTTGENLGMAELPKFGDEKIVSIGIRLPSQYQMVDFVEIDQIDYETQEAFDTLPKCEVESERSDPSQNVSYLLKFVE